MLSFRPSLSLRLSYSLWVVPINGEPTLPRSYRASSSHRAVDFWAISSMYQVPHVSFWHTRGNIYCRRPFLYPIVCPIFVWSTSCQLLSNFSPYLFILPFGRKGKGGGPYFSLTEWKLHNLRLVEEIIFHYIVLGGFVLLLLLLHCKLCLHINPFMVSSSTG